MHHAVAPDMWLQAAANQYGTPAYVYFAAPIEGRCALLRQHLPRFALSFAVKANPNSHLLGWMKRHVDYLDVSSIGEFHKATQAGWEPERVSFTGPGKRDVELSEAIEGRVGELILESLGEARRADAIAGSMNRVQKVMLRISPASVPKGFGDHMAGRPSPFGIDVEDIGVVLPEILGLPNLKVCGLHIYSGTQCLKAEAVCENYRNFLTIFKEVCEGFDLRPQKLVFGSGLGIPYHDGDRAIELEDVSKDIGPSLNAFCRDERFKNTRLVLELGRYLVGEAGFFLTRVTAVKRSRGVQIAVCDGGLNNHLAACGRFGMVVHRNYLMHKVMGQGPLEKVTLVGPLCTSIDRLASDVLLQPLKEGDLVAVHNSGAYGLTASPLHFISHDLPREIFIDETGITDVTVIGRPEHGPVG